MLEFHLQVGSTRQITNNFAIKLLRHVLGNISVVLDSIAFVSGGGQFRTVLTLQLDRMNAILWRFSILKVVTLPQLYILPTYMLVYEITPYAGPGAERF